MSNEKKIIGVCGQSGSGKTAYTQKLNKANRYTVINVDEIVHQLLAGTDRKALGQKLFSNRALLDAHNEKIWKLLEPRIDNIIKESSKPIIIDWLFLPITKYFAMCHKRILILKSYDERKDIVTKRDNITESYFHSRQKNAPIYNHSDFTKIIYKTPKRKTHAFFAGSFDPFTNAHMEIFKQAKRFYNVTIGIGVNQYKTRRFDRKVMQKAIKTATRANVVVYDGFTGDIARKLGCTVLIRGKSNDLSHKSTQPTFDSDFESRAEAFNLENYNLPTEYYFSNSTISSTKIKQNLDKHKDISAMVPKPILRAIKLLNP